MKYYVADAFTDKIFGGNPAGICVPDKDISDETMQKIACENSLSVTAKGSDCDFVSRFFCPELLREDPVTGSSHSSLVPLWSEKLGMTEMTARQLSSRGGTLYCRLCKDDIKLSGKAVLYMQGDIGV